MPKIARGQLGAARRRPARPARGSRRRAASRSTASVRDSAVRPQARDLAAPALPGGRGRRRCRATSGRGRSSGGSSRRGRSRPAPARPTTRAVAQHDDPVGALLDLVQAVRDEDDADTPLALELGDHLAAGASVSVSGQAGGRLVHDDQARVERQRLGDLDELALRERQLGDAACPARSRRRAGRSSGVAMASSCRPVDQLQRAAAGGSRPMKTLAATSRLSNRLSSWCTKAMPAAIASADAQRGCARPVDADRARASARRRRPGSSSGSTCRRRSRRPARAPRRGRRARLTPSSAMTPG